MHIFDLKKTHTCRGRTAEPPTERLQVVGKPTTLLMWYNSSKPRPFVQKHHLSLKPILQGSSAKQRCYLSIINQTKTMRGKKHLGLRICNYNLFMLITLNPTDEKQQRVEVRSLINKNILIGSWSNTCNQTSDILIANSSKAILKTLCTISLPLIAHIAFYTMSSKHTRKETDDSFRIKAPAGKVKVYCNQELPNWNSLNGTTR